jgi:microcystin-dependent protein
VPSTQARLPAGTAGQVLVAEATSVGYAWATVTSALPPGIVLPYGGTAAPTGWLLCNGSVVSRTTYAALFAIVGTAFNTGGEPGTDFRLPDLRGRFPLGKAAAGTGSTLGGSGGAIDHVHTVGTLDTANESTHTHAVGTLAADNESAHTHGAGSYQVTIPGDVTVVAPGLETVGSDGVTAVTGTSAAGSAHGHAVSGATAAGAAHKHTVSGSTALENPPFQAFNFIINTGV